jgi:hypothetical protein
MDTPMEFTVTVQHLVLLSSMYVEWSRIETGAPAINPKRPYGNSDVAFDILQLLGVEPVSRDEPSRYWPLGYPNYSEDQEEWAIRMHRETEYALQICLRMGAFETGTYRRTDKYDIRSWERVPEAAA